MADSHTTCHEHQHQPNTQHPGWGPDPPHGHFTHTQPPPPANKAAHGASLRAHDPTPQRQHGAHHTRNNQGHIYAQHRRDASLMHSREPSPSRPHRAEKATCKLTEARLQTAWMGWHSYPRQWWRPKLFALWTRYRLGRCFSMHTVDRWANEGAAFASTCAAERV